MKKAVRNRIWVAGVIVGGFLLLLFANYFVSHKLWIDIALWSRGFPQKYLGAMPFTAKESLYNHSNLIFQDGYTVTRDGKSTRTAIHNITEDGGVSDPSVFSSDLVLSINVSPIDASENLLVTCTYRWNTLPVCRVEDPIIVSWAPDSFYLVEDTFRKVDKYDSENSTGNINSDEPGYAVASPTGVSWYADLVETPDATALYGYAEFILAPDSNRCADMSTSEALYGSYIHALIPANLNVQGFVANQFGIVNADVPQTINTCVQRFAYTGQSGADGK